MAYENIYTYLLKREVKKAISISISGSGSLTGSSVVIFNATTASAPISNTGSVAVPDTDKDNFMFFVNGAYIDHDAITIQQSGSNFYLYVNRTSVGYDIDSNDEVFGWGKFNS